MNERIHRPKEQYRTYNDKSNYQNSNYNPTPQYNDYGTHLSMEELDADDELAFALGGVMTDWGENPINSLFRTGIPSDLRSSEDEQIIWQTFGKTVAEYFGEDAAIALGLTDGNSPLPIREALDAGLEVKTAWKIAENWIELWLITEQELEVTLATDEVVEKKVVKPVVDYSARRITSSEIRTHASQSKTHKQEDTKVEEDVSKLSSVEKLSLAIKHSASALPGELASELQAIFTPATLATMVSVFAVYVAAHATGVGQAMDIGMLIAGGVFFGMDAFTIFKDIAGFANAVNAQNEDELDKAGQHLASAVAKIGVDAVMTLLTGKVAKKIAGIEEPGTTTGDMDDINRSIRRHNPQTDRHPYTVEDVGNAINENPIASEAYSRITDQGYNVRINHDRPPEPDQMGLTRKESNNVEIWEMNNWNKKSAIGTMVHESVHVDFRFRKRIPNNTRYEEFRAFVREEMYQNSIDPGIVQVRPTLQRRYKIWDEVNELYPELDEGKYPFGGARK